MNDKVKLGKCRVKFKMQFILKGNHSKPLTILDSVVPIDNVSVVYL